MMTSTRYLLLLLRSLVLCMWCGTAAAAGLVLSDRSHLSGLLTDPMVLGLSGGIATAAGITTLAMRVNMLLSQDPSRPLVKPWLFAVAHVGGSYLAAAAGLLVGSMQRMEADAALLVVLVFAFAGSKVLEALAEKYLSVVRIAVPAGDAK